MIERRLVLGIGTFVVLTGVACGASDSDVPTPAPSAQLSSIDARVFGTRCTGPCHSGGENAGGGLDLSKNLHAVLVGVQATATDCADGKTFRVVAGDPEASLLYRKVKAKLEGAVPSCGESMPPGDTRPTVPSAEVEAIRAWIASGAKDD